MARTVMCAKFKKEMPGLEKPPFGGEIGQKIFDQVSAEAWNSWRNDMQIKVLNEYRLNMGDPKDYQVLVDQMLLFLGLTSGETMKVNDK
jgi:Fe-S cluster biosynthesis and repair protein YggX